MSGVCSIYRLEVRGVSPELWRFNVAATAALLDSSGAQVGFGGGERVTSEEFQRGLASHSSLERAAAVELLLDVEVVASDGCSASRLHAIIYFVTHTLPEDRAVEASAPFDADVRLLRDGVVIYEGSHAVNQWGGATIDLSVDLGGLTR